MKRFTSTVRRTAAMTTGLLAAGAAIALTAPQADAAPASVGSAPVTQDALPTVQINGIVWSQVVVGNTVYATGKFTSARPAGSPAGTNETPRANILAYDIRTGVLNTSFVHTLDGQGQSLAVSPDKKRLYLAGTFKQVDGQPRSRVAAFDVASGSLLSWAPQPNSAVYGISATSNAVYFGGVFNNVGGVARTRAAAVSPSGELLPWAPAIDNIVRSVVAVPWTGRVYLGGHFRSVNGAADGGFAGVDAVNGQSVATPASTALRTSDNTTGSGVLNLKTDGSTVYGAAFNATGGSGAQLEGSFAVNGATGAVVWVNNCYGDSYDAAPAGGAVFVASHAHDCSAVGGFPNSASHYFGLAWNAAASSRYNSMDSRGYNYTAYKTSALLQWNPYFNVGTVANQSVWSFAGTSDYVVAGGEFPKVNGVAQQGLVRFAVSSLAPRKYGPNSLGVPTASTSGSGSARAVTVRTTAAWDSDDGTLTYRLIRDGDTANPVATTTQRTVGFWQQSSRPQVTLVDHVTGTHSYRVTVTDGGGSTQKSATFTVA